MQTKMEVTLNGEDAMKYLSPYLLAVTYEDKLSGEADTLDLELTDKEQKFIGDWLPPLGATLSAKIIIGADSLLLGTFELDEITCSYPPSLFKIKAVSISQNSGLRQRDESKSWENVRLSELASDVARNSGVVLFYEASDDPLIKRAEQGEKSRLAFLEKICRDNYLALKFADGKLIIFDESKLDEQKPVLTFERPSLIKNFSARTTLQDIYKSAQVVYKHGKHDELYQGGFDSGKQQGKVLKINRKVDSQAEAEKLARNELREKNKKETAVTFTTVGSFKLLAGNVIELKGHGAFDGNYLIEKARHCIYDGYEVKVECRRCLNW